jgi:predicted aconitase with swiveling domain
MRFQGRSIYSGMVRGEALATSQAISFFGGVDPESGVVTERGHALEGQCIAGKLLVFPTGKGSTVGSYTLYRLKHNNCAPLAILNAECETIIAVGCIIAQIPCVDHLPIHEIATGSLVEINNGDINVKLPTETHTMEENYEKPIPADDPGTNRI